MIHFLLVSEIIYEIISRIFNFILNSIVTEEKAYMQEIYSLLNSTIGANLYHYNFHKSEYNFHNSEN